MANIILVTGVKVVRFLTRYATNTDTGFSAQCFTVNFVPIHNSIVSGVSTLFVTMFYV
jgi:hypothetical protein